MYFYKTPTETKTFSVDFSDVLLSSESIISAATTLSVTNIDTDGLSTSTVFVSSSLTATTTTISFRLNSGEDDAVYKVYVSTGGVTTSGNVYSKICYLYVSEADQSLVSLSDFKDFIGVESTDTDGVLLSTLRAASDFVKRVTGREFSYERYTDTYYLEEPSDRLILKNYPVRNVTSLIVDGITLEASTAGYANYVVEQEGYIRRLDGMRFPAGFFPITVTYNAGYRGVPEDILYAVKKIAARDYNSRLQEGIASEEMGSYKVVYDTSAILSEDSAVRDILSQYTSRLL